jgi:hypothetical protein
MDRRANGLAQHSQHVGMSVWPVPGRCLAIYRRAARVVASCWGLVLKCYELRTRQHKMLNVNILCPTKHYSLGD